MDNLNGKSEEQVQREAMDQIYKMGGLEKPSYPSAGHVNPDAMSQNLYNSLQSKLNDGSGNVE